MNFFPYFHLKLQIYLKYHVTRIDLNSDSSNGRTNKIHIRDQDILEVSKVSTFKNNNKYVSYYVTFDFHQPGSFHHNIDKNIKDLHSLPALSKDR